MSKHKQIESQEQFAHDMLMKAWLNAEDMEGLTPKKQGVRMGKIFDSNDVVFAAFPDMSQPRGSDFAIIKGSTEELLEKPDLATRGVMMTAFMVNDRREAETFAQIYNCRRIDIRSRGRVSDEIKRFWEHMTPAGRIQAGPGTTVKEWAELVDDLRGAADLMDRVRRNMQAAE